MLAASFQQCMPWLQALTASLPEQASHAACSLAQSAHQTHHAHACVPHLGVVPAGVCELSQQLGTLRFLKEVVQHHDMGVVQASALRQGR